MMMHSSEPATAIRRLVEGYQVSQAICVAVTLGIADLLAAGSHTSDELAAATQTHAPTLYRVLRALASVEVLRESEDGRFALTSLGECLRTDAPNSIAGWAAFVGRPYVWQAWANLMYSVQTGENAFQHLYQTDIWTYRAAHPEESAIFDQAMLSLSRRALSALLAAYDFGRFHTLVDVGGGKGALLAGILAEYPELQGILFDQTHVVSAAPAILASAGVEDRCSVVEGSFFAALPAGADAYLLRAIIHDWEDREAIRILQVVRRAIAPDGTLLLLERVVAPPNQGRDAKFSDLNMLVNPGGRERTREEFAALMEAANFSLTRLVNTGIEYVIEGAPVVQS